MATKPLPEQSYLLQRLRYCERTGELTWRARTSADFLWCDNPDGRRNLWNARFAGKPIRSENRHGYRIVRFQGSSYFAHRVIWKMVYGFDPDIVDHINGDNTDNRVSNLRSVSDAENKKNKSRQTNNNSGFSGIRWRKDRARWVVQISENGTNISLGEYRGFCDALAARLVGEKVLGYHEGHGK